jgi:hypothetical protein
VSRYLLSWNWLATCAYISCKRESCSKATLVHIPCSHLSLLHLRNDFKCSKHQVGLCTSSLSTIPTQLAMASQVWKDTFDGKAYTTIWRKWCHDTEVFNLGRWFRTPFDVVSSHEWPQTASSSIQGEHIIPHCIHLYRSLLLISQL